MTDSLLARIIAAGHDIDEICAIVDTEERMRAAALYWDRLEVLRDELRTARSKGSMSKTYWTDLADKVFAQTQQLLTEAFSLTFDVAAGNLKERDG